MEPKNIPSVPQQGSHEKETRANETISTLQAETENLTKVVEAGAGKSITQENTVNTLFEKALREIQH